MIQRFLGLLSVPAVLAALMLSGCSQNEADAGAAQPPRSEKVSETKSAPAPAAPSSAGKSYREAPDFNLELIGGGELQLSSLRGKVVLLDFWATWCGPCRRVIPHLNSLYSRYHDEGLEVIGISLDQGRGQMSGKQLVEAFSKQIKMDYPLVMAKATTARDYGNIQSIPTAFIIDREGKIRSKVVGLRPQSVYEQTIRALLAEEVESVPADDEDGTI